MIAEIETQLTNLPGATALERRADGLWMAAPGLNVQAMARLMMKLGIRLGTITGAALDGEHGETEIIYHYLLDRQPINIKTQTRRHAIPSITPITQAADWIEREIHDLFAVEFPGHPNLARLIRPPQLSQGFFREPGGAASKNR